MTNTPDNDRHERALEGGWTEWPGGFCPVDENALVEVRYLGAENPSKGIRIEWPVTAGILAWQHDGEDDDIVAYRIPPKPHHFNQEGK